MLTMLPHAIQERKLFVELCNDVVNKTTTFCLTIVKVSVATWVKIDQNDSHQSIVLVMLGIAAFVLTLMTSGRDTRRAWT